MKDCVCANNASVFAQQFTELGVIKSHSLDERYREHCALLCAGETITEIIFAPEPRLGPQMMVMRFTISSKCFFVEHFLIESHFAVKISSAF